eukprot:2876187-Prymnesium_polylepis.1
MRYSSAPLDGGIPLLPAAPGERLGDDGPVVELIVCRTGRGRISMIRAVLDLSFSEPTRSAATAHDRFTKATLPNPRCLPEVAEVANCTFTTPSNESVRARSRSCSVTSHCTFAMNTRAGRLGATGTLSHFSCCSGAAVEFTSDSSSERAANSRGASSALVPLIRNALSEHSSFSSSLLRSVASLSAFQSHTASSSLLCLVDPEAAMVTAVRQAMGDMACAQALGLKET